MLTFFLDLYLKGTVTYEQLPWHRPFEASEI